MIPAHFDNPSYDHQALLAADYPLEAVEATCTAYLREKIPGLTQMHWVGDELSDGPEDPDPWPYIDRVQFLCGDRVVLCADGEYNLDIADIEDGRFVADLIGRPQLQSNKGLDFHPHEVQIGDAAKGILRAAYLLIDWRAKVTSEYDGTLTICPAQALAQTVRAPSQSVEPLRMEPGF